MKLINTFKKFMGEKPHNHGMQNSSLYTVVIGSRRIVYVTFYQVHPKLEFWHLSCKIANHIKVPLRSS